MEATTYLSSPTSKEDLERAFKKVLSEFCKKAATQDGITHISRNDSEIASKCVAVALEYLNKKMIEMDNLPF